MIQLYTLLIIAESIDPDVFLALWGSGCLLTVFAAVGGWVFLQNYIATNPSARPPAVTPSRPHYTVRQPHGRHALGDPDRSQAGIPAAVLMAQLRATRPAGVSNHRAGVR